MKITVTCNVLKSQTWFHYFTDEEFVFVGLDEKIHKQAPKSWKTGNGEVIIYLYWV